MSFFKKCLESKISKVFAGVIITSFIALEFSSNYFQNDGQWLFKVGDVEYKAKDWQKSYAAMLEDPMSTQEAKSNPKMAKQRVLDEIITNSLIIQESSRIGFSVSDRMVASEVIHLKTFRDKEGKFSKELLDKYLKNSGLSEAEFVRNMKDQLIRNQLMDIFYNTSGVVAMSTQEFIAKLLMSEQNMVVYSLPILNEKVDYTDGDLKTYMESNQHLFMNPDTADVSTVMFTTDMFQKDNVKPSEEEVLQYYDSHPSLSPEQRVIQQIIISSYNEASEALKNINENKTTYDSVARQYVSKQAIPYEVGPITADSFDPEISNIVFGLNEGDVSELIETPLGWHIFRIKKIIPQHKEEFFKVKDKLSNEIVKQKLAAKMHDVVKEITDEIERGMSIEDIANKYSLVISRKNETTKSLNGDNAEAEYPGFSNTLLLRKIFNEEDSSIKIISANNNSSFMLLKVSNMTKGSLMKLSEASEDVKKHYIQSILNRRTNDKILEIRKDLLEKNNIDTKNDGLTVIKTRFSRLNKNEDIPSCGIDAISAMYQQGRFEGVTSPCREDDEYHVIELKDMDFSQEPTLERVQLLSQTINTIYNQVVFSQFIESLKQVYKVEINKRFQDYLKE